MTRMIVYFLLTVTSISICRGQSKEEIIKDIKNEFQRINTEDNLKVVKLENEEVPGATTDGGRELTGYFKRDSIYKIHDWIGLSFGVKQYDYYFRKGKLFFVYEEEKDFPVDNTKQDLDHTKLVTVFECRYYLDNYKIIDIKSKGRKRFGDTSISSVMNLRSDAESYLKILRMRLIKKSN